MLIYIQGFIQAVLLMSVFEKRSSFRMLYFVKMITNHPKIKMGVGGSVNFAADPWRSLSGG